MKFPLLLAALVLGLTQTLVHAFVPPAVGITVVAPTASTAGSFDINQDITFTINTGVAGGGQYFFVLDEWVTNDGTATSPTFSPGLSISINGGIAQSYSGNQFTDNIGVVTGAFTPNDGYFNVTAAPALAVNNTVTLKVGSYTIPAIAGFNPQGTKTFTGNMFMTDGSAARISNIVAVPEPATWATLLGGIGLLGLAAVRRKTIA